MFTSRRIAGAALASLALFGCAVAPAEEGGAESEPTTTVATDAQPEVAPQAGAKRWVYHEGCYTADPNSCVWIGGIYRCTKKGIAYYCNFY